MGLYTRKSHEREMRALREEYEQRLGELRAAVSELKEENRRLSAALAERFGKRFQLPGRARQMR